MTKTIKTAILVITLLTSVIFAGDLITFSTIRSNIPPRGDIIMSSTLSTGQVIDVWTVLTPLLDKPACATNNHVVRMDFNIQSNGTAFVTWLWIRD